MSPTTKTPQRVSFAYLTPNNLGVVRKLNSVLFPIKYSEKFYVDILHPDVEDFCQLIYYNDVPVGTFCSKLETEKGRTSVYLMTMGILAPYRSRGVGSESIANLLSSIAKRPAAQKIHRIYLHVQTSNEGARRFYEKNGFKVITVQEGYYKKIEPHDAWILEKVFDESADAQK